MKRFESEKLYRRTIKRLYRQTNDYTETFKAVKDLGYDLGPRGKPISAQNIAGTIRYLGLAPKRAYKKKAQAIENTFSNPFGMTDVQSNLSVISEVMKMKISDNTKRTIIMELLK
jgi:hypothetical protein